MGHLFGYARVSTTAQSLDGQVDALTGAGVDERWIIPETGSGRRDDRPELTKLLGQLHAGDTLVVVRLDRLGRSAAHLATLVRDLDERGVTLRSLTEALDTSTPGGRFVVHVLGAMAQMEADLIRERTLEGLAAARARGRVGGRPRVMTEEKIAAARSALDDGQPLASVARVLGVSESSIRRHVLPAPAVGSTN
ncbi:recombinase family protein [Luteimicrobium xylanilyticum]|uniref:R46 site-specific recombinase n=1 Tax=Luteimicrobium xylanilyticum TaxID=1133546 RepID=A0A5P9QG35_9MICO|nr:recombinase family protein [Luteimicrobium xylanilyticum]QFV00033.1 R46 site-specific recombinase [Luteimicrobium xylanilyticum]